MYSSIELLTHMPMRNNFINESIVLTCISFCFSLTDSTHFQSGLGQHIFPLPLSVKLFHAFVNSVRLSFHSLHCFLGFPQPSKCFFFFLICVKFYFCAVMFFEFSQMHNVVYIYHLSTVQNNFTT